MPWRCRFPSSSSLRFEPTTRPSSITSQSGESAEVIRWLKEHEGQEGIFGLTLDPEASLARALPCLVGSGGPELAFAATRSLTVGFALHLAVLAELGDDPEPALAALRSGNAPKVDAALATFSAIRAIVTSGRLLQGLAEALALGLAELSRVPAFSLEGGQLRHGPLEMLGPEVGVLLLRCDETAASLVASTASAALAAGSPVVVFDASGEPPICGAVHLALAARRGAGRDLQHSSDGPGIHAGLCRRPRRRRRHAAAQLEDHTDGIAVMRALAVLGNVNLDLIVGPLAPWPEPGTEVTVAHHQVRAGGAAGNVALAWQELGIPFQIAANVGNDAFGQFLRSEFGAVADRWPVTGTSTTLSIGITHPSGERTFITPLGHLNDFTVEQALSCIDENRLRGGILLTCGSFVMPRLSRRLRCVVRMGRCQVDRSGA